MLEGAIKLRINCSHERTNLVQKWCSDARHRSHVSQWVSALSESYFPRVAPQSPSAFTPRSVATWTSRCLCQILIDPSVLCWVGLTRHCFSTYHGFRLVASVPTGDMLSCSLLTTSNPTCGLFKPEVVLSEMFNMDINCLVGPLLAVFPPFSFDPPDLHH